MTLCDKTFILSSEELKNIEDFHKFTFSDTLHLGEKMIFDPSSTRMPFYVVPVNKGKLLFLMWMYVRSKFFAGSAVK